MSQQQLVETVKHVTRRNGKATTLACAAEWYVSAPTARRWLVDLEKQRLVQRIGKRGGFVPIAA